MKYNKAICIIKHFVGTEFPHSGFFFFITIRKERFWEELNVFMKGVHEKNDINSVILEPVGCWLTFT